MTEGKYNLINAAIGVWFGLAQPIVQRLVTHIIAWLLRLLPWLWARLRRLFHSQDPRHSAETEPLYPSVRETRSLTTTKSSSGWRLFLREWASRLVSVAVILLSIAYAVAGAFITSIPSERFALSGSTNCGLWGLRDDANWAAQDEDDLIQGRKELRAGLYARNCYVQRAVAGLDQCKIFAEPRIDISTMTGLECPFVNSTYCSGSSFTTARFSTGMMDTKRIGLNFAQRPSINRTTLCVPLNLDAGFVKRLNNAHGQWGYDLGPVESDVDYKSNYTFEQSGDPFYYDVRAYTMRQVVSTPGGQV